MSGICGILHFDGRPTSEAELRSMMAVARHRGPDGTGTWLGDGAAFAHLASHLGPEGRRERQPLVSESGRHVIVADARIDNRDELLTALRSRRCPAPDSPGEAALLLEAYLCWGSRCVDHVVGDYAFAVWDTVERRLFAARDPMAMRPFYFWMHEGRCLFASEIGQLLCATDVPRRLFRPMAAAWLMVRAGDPTWTFFDGVRQLPGAHGLAVDGQGARMERVWDVDPRRRLVYRSESEYVDHFRDLLLSATRARLRHEAPSGMLLSGGLDSCAVAGAAGWLMKHEGGRPSGAAPFTAISYAYEGFPDCDERHVSEPLAKHWRMRIEEISSHEWRGGSLLQWPWGVDSPTVGIYRPLQEAAMKRARELGMRQIFMAVRGDNMMGGYIWDPGGLLVSGAVVEAMREFSRYREAYGTARWETVRKTLLASATFTLASLSRRLSERRVRRERASLERKLARGRLADPWVSRELLGEVSADSLLGEGPKGFRSLASRARYDVVFDHFGELGGVQNERHAASHGLRADDPWSDRRIVEFVCAVPQHILNRIGDTKRLTRRALTGLVPPEVEASAQKIIPARFGAHILREREADALLALTRDMRAARAGLVDQGPLAEHLSDFLGGADLISGAWAAITLEAWLRSSGVEA
jgi:asparagine synthase (glutamine-hydrolysing)